MLKRTSILSIALVAVMALTVVAAAGTVTTKAQDELVGPYAPTVTIAVTQNGKVVDATHPSVTGLPVTVTVTFTPAAGASETDVHGDISVYRNDVLMDTFTVASTHMETTSITLPAMTTSEALPNAGETLRVALFIFYLAVFDDPATPGVDTDSGYFTTSSTYSIVAPTLPTEVVLQKIGDLQDSTKPDLQPAMFTNANNHKAFDNKLAEVIKYINAGDYATALAKVQRDVMPKADGAKPDWVTSTYQGDVYAKLQSIESDLIALQSVGIAR